MNHQSDDASEPQKAKEITQVQTPEKATEAPAKCRAELTPEEQMALYEDELKESDWGHQPC